MKKFRLSEQFSWIKEVELEPAIQRGLKIKGDTSTDWGINDSFLFDTKEEAEIKRMLILLNKKAKLLKELEKIKKLIDLVV